MRRLTKDTAARLHHVRTGGCASKGLAFELMVPTKIRLYTEEILYDRASASHDFQAQEDLCIVVPAT